MYRDLLGVKYIKHGRDKNGLDCLGLVIEAGRRNGIIIKDFWKEKIMNPYDYLIRIEKPEKFCIVELANFSAQHVAFYLGDGNIIHSKQNIGVIIEPLMKFRHCIKGYYKVKN